MSKPTKLLIIGGSGYIGQALIKEIDRRGWDYTNLTRASYDYTSFDMLLAYLQTSKPTFVINVSGYAGKPNVDTCEIKRAETLKGNLVLSLVIAHACAAQGIPCGHVSSGCIYNNGEFSEDDFPNFSFRNPPCSFYSGAKAMSEESIAGVGENYVWRLRLPFDEYDCDRNYLSKLQRYAKVYDNTNSLSHRGDFVKACLDMVDKAVPYGVYNMTNPGKVTARQVVEMIKEILRPKTHFKFWENDESFYKVAVAPRSNCVLSTLKLASAGVTMRPVEEALADALHHWRPETNIAANGNKA